MMIGMESEEIKTRRYSPIRAIDRYVRPQRLVYGFRAVLVINRISTLAILASNRVWFLHSTMHVALNSVCFLTSV